MERMIIILFEYKNNKIPFNSIIIIKNKTITSLNKNNKNLLAHEVLVCFFKIIMEKIIIIFKNVRGP